MSYDVIDSVLKRWATAHGLHIYSEFKGEAVRSTDLVDAQGRRCQMWLDPPDSGGRVGVHVWDYRKRRKDFTGSVETLGEVLEQALVQGKEWLAAKQIARS
jgi:hypothetical protein